MDDKEKHRFFEQIRQLLVVSGSALCLVILVSVLTSNRMIGVYLGRFQILNIGNDAIELAVVVLLAVILFFIIREFVTWYWKLNKIIGLLERIEENTRK